MPLWATCFHYDIGHLFNFISSRFVILGNCYSKVRKEIEAMRSAMGEEDYYYNHPRLEVEYLYQDDDKNAPKYQGKYIVEMKKNRPDWFPSNLKTKV